MLRLLSLPLAVMFLIVAFLPGCTSTQAASKQSVMQAYNTANVVKVPSYTRTIFSSTNF